MNGILTGLSLMPSEDFLQASSSLFLNGEVEVLEWSFDTAWHDFGLPLWSRQILDEYSNSHLLLGHGVSYSAFSAKWTKEHETWLEAFELECKLRNYSRISEHFGFSSAALFSRNSPLPVPFTESAFKLALERLGFLKELSGVEIGIENLAFAFSKKDLLQQAAFLKELLLELEGFLLLDLHNLFCQMENFQLGFSELSSLYPLELVKEIHVSGGSYSIYGSGAKSLKIRRDTHDDQIPPELFSILPELIVCCPQLEFVIVERLSETMRTESQAEAFRSDFFKIKEIVNATA